LAGEPIKSSQANAGGGRKKKNGRCLGLLLSICRQPALAYGLLGVLRPMLAGLFGVLTAVKRNPFLPLTCICVRCRDSAQHPSLAEFRPTCAAQRRGRQARTACGVGLAAQPRDCRDFLRAGA